MSSIQYGLPLATNKVLNAIDVFRTTSENALDYYVEPIMTDTLVQIYRVHVNYIKGIHVVGTLCHSDQSRVEGDTIPNAQLIQGKLYTVEMFPFFLVHYDGNYQAFHLSNNLHGATYDVYITKIDITGHSITPYTYNYKTNEVKLYEGSTSPTKPEKICPSVYVTNPSIDTDGTLQHNRIYYFEDPPAKVQDELICWGL